MNYIWEMVVPNIRIYNFVPVDISICVTIPTYISTLAHRVLCHKGNGRKLAARSSVKDQGSRIEDIVVFYDALFFFFSSASSASAAVRASKLRRASFCQSENRCRASLPRCPAQ